MTLNEFKAWMDGFSHSVDGAPTKEQWQEIRNQLVNVFPEVQYIPQLPHPYPLPGPFIPQYLSQPNIIGPWYSTCQGKTVQLDG